MVLIIAALIAVLASLGWAISGPIGAIVGWVLGSATVLALGIALSAWGREP